MVDLFAAGGYSLTSEKVGLLTGCYLFNIAKACTKLVSPHPFD
jgi:hypothetical protein